MRLSTIAELRPLPLASPAKITGQLRGRRQGQARARRQRYHLMVRQKLRLWPEEEAQRSTSLPAIIHADLRPAPPRLVIALEARG